jgi:hypothetical protein
MEKQNSQDNYQSSPVTGMANGASFTQQPSTGEKLDEAPVSSKSHTLYKIGYVMRLIGLLGVLAALAYELPTGPYAVLMFLTLWWWALPALLFLAIGHYLASNNKEK